jgi:hypothetical protein
MLKLDVHASRPKTPSGEWTSLALEYPTIETPIYALHSHSLLSIYSNKYIHIFRGYLYVPGYKKVL